MGHGTKGMQPWVRVRLNLWYLRDSWVKAQKLDIVVWISGQRSELEIKSRESLYLAVVYSLHCYFCSEPRSTWKNSPSWPLYCYYLTLLWIPVLHSIPWSFKMVFCPSWEEVNLQLPNLSTDNSEERICQECPRMHPIRVYNSDTTFSSCQINCFWVGLPVIPHILKRSVATRQVFLSLRSHGFRVHASWQIQKETEEAAMSTVWFQAVLLPVTAVHLASSPSLTRSGMPQFLPPPPHTSDHPCEISKLGI